MRIRIKTLFQEAAQSSNRTSNKRKHATPKLTNVCMTVSDGLWFIQRKYWDLKCWSEFEIWIYEGRVFQMDAPGNVFRYISKYGFGVYNRKLDDERNSIAWMSVLKVNDVFRYSGAFPRIVLNIWIAFWYKTRSGNVIHFNSANIKHDAVLKSQSRITWAALFWSLTNFSFKLRVQFSQITQHNSKWGRI